MRLNQLTAHLLAAATLALPAAAQDLPTTPTIVSGVVDINTSVPGIMTVNAGDSAIVNWNSFSVGAGGLLTFHQPNANSVILNRVTGDTTSTIAGTMTANGQVFIVNPNGIAITSTGVVNTAGLTASTLGISDADFLAGNYTFQGDGSSATVSNAGQIEVASGGYVALLGGRVNNSGSIIAPLGTIGLGAAELITLDFTGDGFLQVAVPSNLDGDDPLISNSGLISANGGHVQMSVAAAQDAARNVINLSGTVEARSFSGRSGSIVLSGDGGQVTVSGKVDTSTTSAAPPPQPKVQLVPIPASRPNFRGGDIIITGNAIKLADADIDASGFDGGGDIRIGGDFHGNGLITTASTLDVDFLTSIKADALIDGNGGTVVLWSDDTTRFAGDISVRGAGLDGSGGDVEVSGAKELYYTGRTDRRAPSGKWGTLLLDPTNIAITASVPPPGYSQLSPATIMAELALGNVIVNTSTRFPDSGQVGNIWVLGGITWTTPSTLQLIADGGILFGSGANLSGINGNLILTAAGDIDMGAALATGVTFTAVNLTMTGQNIYLYDVDMSGFTSVTGRGLVDIDFQMDSDLGILINAGGDLRTYFDEVGMESTLGDITLNAGGSLWLAHPYLRALTGNVTLTAAGNANLAGNISAANLLRVQAGGDIDLTIPPGTSITGIATLMGAPVSLQAGGTLFLRTGSSVTASTGDIVANVGVFQNQAGALSLLTPNGRHIVYSNDWAADFRNELPGVNLYNRTFTSSPPGTTNPGQDVFVYARQPVITFTIADAMRMYFGTIPTVPGVTYNPADLVNGDSITYAILGDINDVRDTTAADADVGLYPGALRPFNLSSPPGYRIVYVGGNLTVTPAPLTVIANSFSKVYGDTFVFDGTQFTTVGLRGTDVAGTVTLTSVGASGTATVLGSPYAILASNATGGDFGNYTISYQNGALTVTPRTLTISALDLYKLFRTDFAFNGTEFTTAGLVNADRVDTVNLTSTGQPADVPLGFYPILVANATGTGLDNYSITYAPGVMTVIPASGPGTILPNYPPAADTPTIIGLLDPNVDVLPGVLDPDIAPGDARVTLQNVERLSQQFAAAIAECERQLETNGDEGAYLTCASDALEAYADDLENPLIKLPPELKAAVRVIRETAQRVRAAASNPNPRLAVAEARQAVGQMVDFVRQQTALVRAVDPDTQALLQQSGQVMTQALNELDLQLVSAVEI